MTTWLFSLIGVGFISIISLIGVIVLSFQEKRIKGILIYLVSFAAGAFFGDVFIHLIPETIEEFGWSLITSFSVLFGIVFFLVTEKIIKWRHCHDAFCETHTGSLAAMNLIGDGVHNFVDGLIVAASFLISAPVGVATTITIILHEIPQEIGDFGVLLHGGYTKKKAIFFNIISALTAIIGAAVALLTSQYIPHIEQVLIPFAIGSFIYIGGSDLIPEIQKETKLLKSFSQIVTFVLGIVVMAVLLMF